jgi:hypothetical protein
MVMRLHQTYKNPPRPSTHQQQKEKKVKKRKRRRTHLKSQPWLKMITWIRLA